ncbi:nuclear transport factor 2 family protein [Herbiconiux daphne]|uniref:Nuclear transport factor 2 family protein n=1 Tax=Herbiconiux daphne TaxID=2970914 RepID=A0ABT2H6Y8_9MICO|nr:nuclear transport factor 2 family protein [Herbiconiux daphne]MCS5735730.1 nuclear transport factor 2 family protein [Herbiconiux daphne]
MNDKQTILELDLKRREAMISADVESLSQLLGDELVWIHATGKLDDKGTVLKAIGEGATVYERITVEDETVRFFEGVALVTGMASMTLVSRGARKELENRFTIVWAPAGDSYQAVNWQSTSLR